MFSIILVDYNSISKSIEYIVSFPFCGPGDEMHVVLIDNSPVEQYEQLLMELERRQIKAGVFTHIVENREVRLLTFPGMKIVYCYSGENLGYARGNNLGTELADEVFGDPYYIISNNDIRLPSSFVFAGFEKIFMRDASIAVIGPHVVGLDGKPQSPHKRVGAWKRLIFYYWFNLRPFCWHPDYDSCETSKYCYRVMGSFMIVRAELFRQAGRFDPHTFLFAEEPILSERLERIGAKTYYYNDFTVVHEHGATVSETSTIARSERWAFDSLCYYFSSYLKTPGWVIAIAKRNFKAYLGVLKARTFLRSLLKQGHR